eukprot:scaffold206279_cov32-Tisochrysis_lutea.AAC.1
MRACSLGWSHGTESVTRCAQERVDSSARHPRQRRCGDNGNVEVLHIDHLATYAAEIAPLVCSRSGMLDGCAGCEEQKCGVRASEPADNRACGTARPVDQAELCPLRSQRWWLERPSWWAVRALRAGPRVVAARAGGEGQLG